MPEATRRDAGPSVDRIEELAYRIVNSDILLPKFQREFVWKRQQILDLWDSIYRNYPIGSILLWRTREQLESERSIADLKIKPRPAEYPTNYLLDGQQRLSSICGAIYWTGEDAKSVWNLAFDLREQKFVHLDTLDAPPLHVMRLNSLADPFQFLSQANNLLTSSSYPERVELAQRAKDLLNRFKDYKIATVTIGDMSVHDVAPIFERINSTGTPLTIVDLMRAATWSPEFDLLDTIDCQVLDAVKEYGFESIERRAVLRNLSAAAGGAFHASSIDDLRNKKSLLPDAARATVSSYKLAVDFFVNQLGVVNAEILPYSNQIVVLSEVFRRLPRPTKDQSEALRRWFWRTSASEYFGGWNTGQMVQDHEAIKRFAEDTSKELEFVAARPTPDNWAIATFRLNNALSKCFALLLAAQGPRDLLTGNKISLNEALAWQNSREFHHIFPRAFLRARDTEARRIGHLANFTILESATNKSIADRPPSQYIDGCRRQLGAEFKAVMASHLIDDNCLEALSRDDFNDFISARSACLHAAAMKLAEW
jgi:hypothetical protein